MDQCPNKKPNTRLSTKAIILLLLFFLFISIVAFLWSMTFGVIIDHFKVERIWSYLLISATLTFLLIIFLIIAANSGILTTAEEESIITEI
jgi:hypothetical protein